MMTTIKPISTPRVFESIASHANRLNERAAAVDRYGSSLASAWEEQGSVPDQSTIRRPKRMSCLFGEQSEALECATLVVVFCHHVHAEGHAVPVGLGAQFWNNWFLVMSAIGAIGT